MRHRPRRLRLTPQLRTLVRETSLRIDQLIAPIFVGDHVSQPNPIASMPGVMQWPVAMVGKPVEELVSLGINAVLLFGIPAEKDSVGSGAYDEDGVVQRAVRDIKKEFPELIVITDVCLCEYTDHGHCGVFHERTGGQPVLANDESVELLGRIAVSQARAGADIVAPSAMLDGMVARIRADLDTNGFPELAIMSYSAKFASTFYGPFRDAAGGAPKFGDRRSHQMDPANGREAVRESALDVHEGADILMVKPALAYLDVIARTRHRFPDMPLAAYNVSGEYAMIKAAAAAGVFDERTAVLEALTAIRRAGANLLITYHAADVARWLNASASH